MSNQMIDAMEKTYKEAIAVARLKNHDYANSTDPYRNFRFAELVGVGVERAILVRMSDKLARISNLIDSEAKVKDETIADTLSDLINYTAILKAYLEQ